MPHKINRYWYSRCPKCSTLYETHVDDSGYKTEAAFHKAESSSPRAFSANLGACIQCAEKGIRPPGTPTVWSETKPEGKVYKLTPVKKKAEDAPSTADRLKRQDKQPSDMPVRPQAANPCTINLTLNIFFDGTGNNLKTDEGTKETSNIARLYQAHEDDDPKNSIYRVYVPGIGTRFPEIGDAGYSAINEDGGLASFSSKYNLGTGGMGQERLDWAEKQIDEKIAAIPADKLKSVRISLFGFSRGAAQARAFAAQLHGKKERCEKEGASWKYKTKAGNLVDFEIYFMGLYDCVASAGLPASARKYASDVVKYGSPFIPALGPLGPLIPIAAKKAAQASGHDGWAEDLKIPPTVKAGVHYYSVHEVRNSFPLDSLRVGNSIPATTPMQECGYYGVHSNVGGGYRPGENGRSMQTSLQLSNIPLNKMYEMAKEHGVALMGNKEMPADIKEGYVIAGVMQASLEKYLATCKSAELAPHEMMQLHMRPYIRWRSYRYQRGIAKFNADTAIDIEAQSRKEEAEHKQAIKAIDEKINANVAEARRYVMMSNYGSYRELRRLAAEREKLEAERTIYTNKIATLPTHYTSSEMQKDKRPERSSKYWNMWEAKQKELKAQIDLLKVNKKDGMPLLKYHEMLIEAWDESLSFEKDAAIYEFFDNFVHDSASDFDSDRSLLIDPRTVFVGGDDMALESELDELIKKRKEWKKKKDEEEAQKRFDNIDWQQQAMRSYIM